MSTADRKRIKRRNKWVTGVIWFLLFTKWIEKQDFYLFMFYSNTSIAKWNKWNWSELHCKSPMWLHHSSTWIIFEDLFKTLHVVQYSLPVVYATLPQTIHCAPSRLRTVPCSAPLFSGSDKGCLKNSQKRHNLQQETQQFILVCGLPVN